MSLKRKNHWENVYEKKLSTEVSWYQAHPTVSLELIASTGINHDSGIIDVGGGASALVDKLLDEGFKDLTILDISSQAMDYAKNRLGKRAENVNWIEADITDFDSSVKYDLWHDRAVFHFLINEEDRKRYVACMNKSLNPGGHVIISTFAIDGPLKCSGLPIERYNPEKMKNELGDFFNFIRSADETHRTPSAIEQKFTYFYFKKVG
jgi:2-polyprenyl-3-methyl-5-hydroxy-6-metoxy-1,4-benzoquinol methylase